MEFREPPHINPTLNEPRRIVLLGSTGSIGTQAIDVADAAPERFRIVALAGGSNIELLARQAVHTRAEVVALADGDVDELRARIHEHAELAGHSAYHPELLAGPTAAARVAGYPEADVVLNGVTGSIGLAPTLAALKAGHLLALANKESLIAGGALVKQAAAPGQLVPVDSEHSAIAQALRAGTPEEVARLIVTASGGPFRGMTRQQLMDVTPAQALAHPTWEMGKVVSTNSATMVNKALEVIEAHLLFDVPLQKIEAVVHPQSMVHSMVEFIDGSTIAQASPPDMRLPIALGMGWPARVPGSAAPCDFTTASSWSFEPLDEEAFPAIRLAKQAANTSATHMAVYNAANEEAVEAFHAGRIRFPDIVDCVADVVGQYDAGALVGDELSVQAVLVAEAWARKCAQERWGQL
ncbi:1-deoxy-D-xylulose-5-phosphate reductoisomerase [Arthrobacter rhombi]|uniref:1-deoxy-D-xylulose-5-phosphate reductoisomerase n=1 Tax=Arthrobacter rhombi TaxID=71253 RepID=UPI003FD46D0B